MLNILDMTADTNNFRVMDLESINADVTFDDDYSLKLTSKKLQSGKCQVKFFANVRDRQDMYGYVLSGPRLPYGPLCKKHGVPVCIRAGRRVCLHQG